MRCPVCGAKVAAQYTRQGRRFKAGLMLVCPDDSRHFRGFVNDPAFLENSSSFTDANALIKAIGR